MSRTKSREPRRQRTRRVKRAGTVLTRFAILLLSAALATTLGCSSHYSTLRGDRPGSGTLYRLSRPEALQIAYNALSEMFPGRQITAIDGPPAGYFTSYRMMLDTYSQQVLAVPAIGLDPTGNEVRGYYFEVSGSGSAVISGRAKNSDLFHRVEDLAQRSAQAVSVTSWRIVYEAPAAPAPPAAPVAPVASKADSESTRLRDSRPAAVRLRELDALRTEGLISEDEYRAKRSKILDDL